MRLFEPPDEAPELFEEPAPPDPVSESQARSSLHGKEYDALAMESLERAGATILDRYPRVFGYRLDALVEGTNGARYYVDAHGSPDRTDRPQAGLRRQDTATVRNRRPRVRRDWSQQEGEAGACRHDRRGPRPRGGHDHRRGCLYLCPPPLARVASGSLKSLDPATDANVVTREIGPCPGCGFKLAPTSTEGRFVCQGCRGEVMHHAVLQRLLTSGEAEQLWPLADTAGDTARSSHSESGIVTCPLCARPMLLGGSAAGRIDMCLACRMVWATRRTLGALPAAGRASALAIEESKECRNCGAPLQATPDGTCAYCGTQVVIPQRIVIERSGYAVTSRPYELANGWTFYPSPGLNHFLEHWVARLLGLAQSTSQGQAPASPDDILPRADAR